MNLKFLLQKLFCLDNYCKISMYPCFYSALCFFLKIFHLNLCIYFLQIKESKERTMSMLSSYRVVGSHDFAQDSSSSSPYGTEMGPLPFNSILYFVSEIYQVSLTNWLLNIWNIDIHLWSSQCMVLIDLKIQMIDINLLLLLDDPCYK